MPFLRPVVLAVVQLAAILAVSAVPTAAAAAQSTYAVKAPPPPGLDRAEAQRATKTHLINLIRLDTQNPPGNETLVAAYLDSVLKQLPGIETRILNNAALGRANFAARLRAARPTRRAVLVLGHMDVVGVDTTKWTVPPFEATVHEGYLYGRGAIDDKGMIAATVAALEQLAPRRSQLARDIIFLATAGEEGGPAVGMPWIADSAFDMIADAEFALNEGGRIRVRDGAVHTVNIQTTEKLSYRVVATATGPSGHGSVPLPNNALAALARAVARVHAWRAPARLTATTRLYFARLARAESDTAVRRAMERLSAAGADSAAVAGAAEVLSRNPLHSAVLRTGHSLTLLDGGIRSNVIPSEGNATFNVRTIPGDDVLEVVSEMNRVGAEPTVTFSLDGEPRTPPPASPVTTPLFLAMEEAASAMVPGAVVIPFMSTGATDGAVLRAKGIPTYGILPMPLPMEDELRMHGDDERVPIPALGWAAEYLYRVLWGVTR
ncbi:MAG: M20/M25/M40 family metallo-hydrolase [Gemmatimonadota bacterium]|nr:M20/M25/M40 family metallo-hydrolase [Gemmatimonadota bacterium]